MTDRLGEIRTQCDNMISLLSDGASGCAECEYHGEPNGCNRPDGECDAYSVCNDAADLISLLFEQLEHDDAELAKLRKDIGRLIDLAGNWFEAADKYHNERDAAVKDMTEFGNRSTTVPCMICKWYKKGECCDRSKLNCFEWRGAEPTGEGKQ